MTLSLFQGFGIELELMIVDATSLDVAPLADRLLAEASGAPLGVSEVERGEVAWSNELQLHVIEMKTHGPALRLDEVGAWFQAEVDAMNHILAGMGARLLPTAMHPWMDPNRELRLWPHGDDVIYRCFDRIFDCRGHGWSNLQSMHINLPFANDGELARLHAAVRTVLPILPALAASSPFVEGARAPELDHRLAVYATNAARIPSVSGRVVPEPIYDRATYEAELLGRIYRDLAPHDPDAILRHEWVNARGAIARFDRMALEIRTLDVQENPLADLAVAQMVVALVRAMVDERWAPLDPELEVDRLASIHDAATRQAGRLWLDDRRLLRAFGRSSACSGATLWGELSEVLLPLGAARDHVRLIAERGTLAERLVASVTGPTPTRDRLLEIYRDLADGLASGRTFSA